MVKIRYQNVFDKWKLPDKSVQAIITSPPYYALRKYDIPDIIIGGDKNCDHEFLSKDAKLHNGRGDAQNSLANCVRCGAFKGQYGLETSLYDYIEHTVLWAREAYRVLKDDGLFFLNIGDSYSSSKRCTGGNCGKHVQDGKNKYDDATRFGATKINTGMPQKTKMLIPHRIAIALIDDGWILRNDIIWHKPNAMPESCLDRFSKKYENVFMFSKSKKYYFNLDRVRTPHKKSTVKRYKTPWNGDEDRDFPEGKQNNMSKFIGNKEKTENALRKGKNPGDMWAINTQPLMVKHYAAWPEKLVEIMVKCSTKKGDAVLDPFCGSGRTLKVAHELGVHGFGIDLGYEDVQQEVLK